MEEYKRFKFSYGLIFLRTKKFIGIMDKIGRLRVTKPISWLLTYFMPVCAGIAVYFFVSQIFILFSPRGQQVAQTIRSLGPLSVIGIPGINPYLPLVDGWISLIVAIIIHEGAHGVVARSLGLRVKSSGLLFFLFIPVGAFVEVDDKELESARARDSSRVLGSGAGINFAFSILCLFLLAFSVVPSMVPKANGLAVTSVFVNYPAYNAGIKPGDIIIAINGTTITDPFQIEKSSWYRPGVLLDLTVYRDGTIFNTSAILAKNPENSTLGFLGVGDIGSSQLSRIVSGYSSAIFNAPFLYLCIPTIPNCQQSIPFSGPYSVFYTSYLGAMTLGIANLLYWMFFINFNLAIINSLPIYAFDGGQAFRVFIKGLSKGKLSEEVINKITAATSSVMLFLLIFAVAGPYLGLV